MTISAEPGAPLRMAELAAKHLNAAPEDLSIVKLTGDASTRAYFRTAAGGASLVVALYGSPFDESETALERLTKLEAVNPAARLTFANDPCAHIETTALFLGAGLPVPRILGVSGRDALMMFEDVGDVRLQDWLVGRDAAASIDAYKDAVALIIKIQQATASAIAANSICANMAFDEAKLRWELGFFFANYFNRHLHMRLDPAEANGVQADFKAISQELAARPRVLTHRDYHARNLMMLDDRMFIIDFQDARMGPASYDLASIVSDPYTALGPQAAGELVEHFIELKMRSELPLADVAEFRRELDLMTVQRMLKAVGTYASQAALANNPTYIPYIAPAVERALAAMESLGRFGATRALLERARASGS